MRQYRFILSILLLSLPACSTNQATQHRSSSDTKVSPVFEQAKLSRELITITHYADREEIFDLVAKGANPNAATDKGLTPLHLAVAKANYEALAALLDQGAKPNVVDDGGISPLKVAIMTNDSQAFDMLITAGADPNYSPKPFSSPILSAVYHSNIKMIDLLIKHGADINIVLDDGEGYIYPLVACKDDETFKHLLELGANTEIYIDKEKELSLLLILVYEKQTNKLAIALENGADPNFRATIAAPTPLHIAAENNHVESIELLLRYGANALVKDKFSHTPLDYAKNKNAKEAVAILTKASGQ